MGEIISRKLLKEKENARTLSPFRSQLRHSVAVTMARSPEINLNCFT